MTSSIVAFRDDSPRDSCIRVEPPLQMAFFDCFCALVDTLAASLSRHFLLLPLFPSPYCALRRFPVPTAETVRVPTCFSLSQGLCLLFRLSPLFAAAEDPFLFLLFPPKTRVFAFLAFSQPGLALPHRPSPGFFQMPGHPGPTRAIKSTYIFVILTFPNGSFPLT